MASIYSCSMGGLKDSVAQLRANKLRILIASCCPRLHCQSPRFLSLTSPRRARR